MIDKYKLPFKLWFYHETQREFEAAVDYYGDRLRQRTWSPTLSRAAAHSPNISGIEARYHQVNAEHPILVTDFMSPYEHLDVLLQERGIDLYKERRSNKRMKERADLLADYKDYLSRKNRQKGENQIEHDVALLDLVHDLGDSASSSLTTSALILTCDYYLYGFEADRCQRSRSRPQVLLPNLFMQIIRPFVPSTDDFDRSFAETFAIPEFRIIGSGAAEAASRMLGLLAAYANLTEETAIRLLSNHILLGKLTQAESDKEIHQLIEAEIVKQNSELLEENEELGRRIEAEKQQRESLEFRLAQADNSVSNMRVQVETTKDALAVAKTETQTEILRRKHIEEARVQAEKAAEEEKVRNQTLERQLDTVSNVVRCFVSLLAFGLSVLVFSALEWNFLLSHPRRSSLILLASCAVGLSVLGVVKPKWRTSAWVGALGSAVFALLQNV
jgi:hypothetical protein